MIYSPTKQEDTTKPTGIWAMLNPKGELTDLNSCFLPATPTLRILAWRKQREKRYKKGKEK